MANNLKDATQELLQFTCLLCDKYLTVPPIYISGDGTKYRCGRCKDIECEANIRCVLLENIAGHLTVPCIYKKCEELLSWRNVEKHEKLCIHRTMSCPVYFNDKCRIEIEMNQLLDHFLVHHKMQVHHKNQLTYNLPKNSRTVVVLNFMDIPYLVYISYQKVVITAMKPTRCSTYNLKISGTSNSSPSLLYEGQKSNEDYVERIHCCECLAGRCQRKSHPYSSIHNIINKELKYTPIMQGHLQTIFGRFKNLTLTIDIIPGDGTKGNDSVSTDIMTPLKRLTISNTDNAILKNFECPVCMQLLTGAIFSCQTGHPICNNCKPKIDTCPSCQAHIGSSRNFPLESLREILRSFSTSNTDINILRKNFECPVCMQLLTGPIFSCQTGHPICNSCKPKIDTCPSCQAQIGSSRNFPLESLTEIVHFPCSDQNCDSAGNSKELAIPEKKLVEI